MTVVMEDVGKSFGGPTPVLEDVSVRIEPGEFVCLLGASGCGKSTLLNIIARLEAPTAGVVKTPREGAAFMFQDAALFPWLTARGNIELALRFAGVAAGERRERAGELLRLVHLDDAADLRPHQLSGGMRQRVGLARALAADTDIILMDEAFSALDPLIRAEMQDQLLELQKTLHKTIVFITHDLDEAVRIGNRIAILKDGKLIQVGTPREILHSPADEYVDRFVQRRAAVV